VKRMADFIHHYISTGELLPLSPPGNLRNISYTIDLIVPLVRCQGSNETVKTIIAQSAFDEATLGLDGEVVPESSIFHSENMTFTVDIAEYNRTFQEQIGYYAMAETTSNYIGEL
jgi:hypothetical protein